MLRRSLLIPVLILTLNVIVETEADAQVPLQQRQQRQRRSSVRDRPAVSPYLNLLRGGSSPTQNYFNLVKPEVEFRSGIQQNSQNINSVQQQTNSLQMQQDNTQMFLQQQARGSRLGATGHTTSFMSHSRFFGGR